MKNIPYTHTVIDTILDKPPAGYMPTQWDLRGLHYSGSLVDFLPACKHLIADHPLIRAFFEQYPQGLLSLKVSLDKTQLCVRGHVRLNYDRNTDSAIQTHPSKTEVEHSLFTLINPRLNWMKNNILWFVKTNPHLTGPDLDVEALTEYTHDHCEHPLVNLDDQRLRFVYTL